MSDKVRILALALALGFTAAAIYYGANYVSGHLGQRAALDYTDGQLPEKLAAIVSAPNREAILTQYRAFLWLDNYLVALILLGFLCIALSASLGSRGSRSPKLLALAAVLYALSDWGENWILLNAVADLTAGKQPAGLGVAAAAQWTKWVFFTLSAVLVPLSVLRSFGRPWAWGRALFLDMPALVDDLWRRLEFHCHKERHYNVEDGKLEARPWYRRTSFWLFGCTALFVAYGPTLDGVCSAAPQVMEVLVWLPVALLVWLACRALMNMWPAIRDRIALRFEWLKDELRKSQPHDKSDAGARAGSYLDERESISRILSFLSATALVLPMFAAAFFLGKGVVQRGWCIAPKESDYFWLFNKWRDFALSESSVDFSGYSLARLALLVIAVAAFARISKGETVVRKVLRAQAALLFALALGTWLLSLLSPGAANEASHQPYVHLFLIFAPIVCVLLCATPWIAGRRLRKLHTGEVVPTCERFRILLAKQQLFVSSPADPELSLSRVLHAATHGFSDRVLQLLIPPALLALIAPADWLWTVTSCGLVLAFLISTWGNMSTRWQHMVLDVQRWFLHGTAFFVSLFVIALAIARLAEVGYVTTILNAAPFGVVFGMVLMSYALSWLVEYWINRVAAVELLSVLGGQGQVTMPYKPPHQPTPAKKDDVERTDCHLMVHGIGRFAVVGRFFDQDRKEHRLAFHSYDLLDLFRALPRDKDGDAVQHAKDLERVKDGARRTDLYFHAFNAVLIGLAVVFSLGYKYGPRYTDPAAVVEAHEQVPTAKYFDLAEKLLASEDNNRPALIVAASGGGTRAALHTAHVLQGLHRLGAAGDIVLMSGVSGGGVALAYFAANRATLVGPSATDANWDKFRQRIAQPFIEDVLEGATELRVYRADSVSMLLAESFNRRLAEHGGRWKLDLPQAGLILNTAISGHPHGESDVLETTLDTTADCKERDRPYNLMGGGRLVFTNLKETRTFPQRDVPDVALRGHRIPDVRLPYVVVRDPEVDLGKAAALNANFPPAFPNARVLVRGTPGADCPDRSFFVTDGGAQENLGLVSALYAVHGALDDIQRACRGNGAKTHPWCKRKLRPIRFVVAEASAATLDYEEDRGLGAAFSAKDRLTGGLTDELIRRMKMQYPVGAVPAVQDLEFDFLALPLAFRARGGLGTHWMHAAHVQMTDPRARRIPSWYEFRERARVKATISREQLDKLWYTLHDPAKDYCGKPAGNTEKDLRDFYAAGDRDTDTVRRWICGAHGDKHAPRDHHVGGWKKLRDALRDPKRTL